MKLNIITAVVLNVMLLMGYMFYAAAPAQALMNQPEEASLRAAVVVGILRYTQLPSRENPSILICASGQPSSQDKLQQVSPSLKVNAKKLNFKIVEENAKSLSDCDLLIIGGKNKLSATLLANYSGLSVCDGCKTGLKTSVIELINKNNRIGFNVNLGLASKNNIVFSSSLLELANKIERPE
ncbi:YfiR family protein [Catenovulum sediminis]|uniref:YfiR family protein n=1 Tax=Catenovulum sediminis TaxID=1740262 RepID=UPI00118063FE|nr:YfiR family protein [Catenovulum sediminis]